MTEDDERDTIREKLTEQQALLAAVTSYTAAIMAQLKQAEAAGAWPDKLTVAEPITAAEWDAFHLVTADLRKQMPDTRIMITRAPGGEP